MAQKRKGSKQGKEIRESDHRGSQRKSPGGRNAESNKPGTNPARREESENLRMVSPFSLMRRFSEEMDHLFGDFGFGGSLTSGVWPDLGSERDQSLTSDTIQLTARQSECLVLRRPQL